MALKHAASAAAQTKLGRELLHLAETELADPGLIDDALARLQDGTYGRCVDCGATIAPARLRVVPWACRCPGCHAIFLASGPAAERARGGTRKAVATATHPRFELEPLSSSTRLRGVGVCPAAAFAQVGLALTATIATPATVQAQRAVGLHCEAPDLEALLGAWMGTLAQRMAARELIFRRFILRVDGETTLEAVGWGEPIDPGRHPAPAWLGAAGFSRLRVFERPDDAWVAECDLFAT